MKRIFELSLDDVVLYEKKELLDSIKNSEGRTLMAETVVSCEPLVYGVSNPETAAAFGADMVTLNTFDFEYPFIWGMEEIKQAEFLDKKDNNLPQILDCLYKHIVAEKDNLDCIRKLKRITGRFVGANLEPVPESCNYATGLSLNRKNIEKAVILGLDYIVITGNPKTMVTKDTITDGVKLAKEIAGDKLIIIAGKMHCAGAGNIYEKTVLQSFAKAGADVVMIAAPLTIPCMTLEKAKDLIEEIHVEGKLALTAIGTSQEGAERSLLEQIAVMSKAAGADIIHIGDAGHAGIADPENIKGMSIAIRGKRHTYRRICYKK